MVPFKNVQEYIIEFSTIRLFSRPEGPPPPPQQQRRYHVQWFSNNTDKSINPWAAESCQFSYTLTFSRLWFSVPGPTHAGGVPQGPMLSDARFFFHPSPSPFPPWCLFQISKLLPDVQNSQMIHPSSSLCRRSLKTVEEGWYAALRYSNVLGRNLVQFQNESLWKVESSLESVIWIQPWVLCSF